MVDDNPVNRKVAEAVLSKLGYAPQVAEDGRQAVDSVMQNKAAGSSFDVVFMDVQMPVLDGLEATRIIKSTHGTAAPVVIAMTAATAIEDRANCVKAGMDDYVSKPINIRELQIVLARWATKRAQKEIGKIS